MTRKTPTIIPDLGKDYWSNSLLNKGIPLPWNDDEARAQGGTVKAIMDGIAANLEVVNQQLVYGWQASRIQTATDVELDLAAKDFYGDGLPRLPGETDAAYRLRIIAGLFIPKVTKQAFRIGLTNLLGEEPRLIDPWIAGQTSAYDWSYYDVDTPEIPGLYGDPSLKYQAAVIANLPPPVIFSSTGVLWGYDIGAAYDAYTGAYSPATAAQFFSANEVDNFIKSIKAAGITIWRKYLYSALVTWIVGNSVAVPRNDYQLVKSIQQFAGPYIVIASGDWNTNYFVPVRTAQGYTVEMNVPSPSNFAKVHTVAIPFTVPNSGLIYCTAGDQSCLVGTPKNNLNARLAVTPSWNTTTFISNRIGTDVVVSFGTSSPPGGTISFYWMPDTQSAFLPLSAGSLAANIAVPGISGVPLVTPSWNTNVACSIVNGILEMKFSVPAPTGAFVHYGYVLNGQKIGAANLPTPPAPPPTTGLIPPPKRLEFLPYDGNDSSTQMCALTNDCAHLFVGCYGATPSSFDHCSILKVNVASGAVEASRDYAAGSQPGWVFISPDNSKVFNVWYDSGLAVHVDVLDPTDLSVISSTASPGGMGTAVDAVMAADGSALAFYANLQKVYVFDTTALTWVNFTASAGAFGTVAFKLTDPTRIYVSSQSTTNIYEFDTGGTLHNTFATGITLTKIDIIRVHPISGQIFGAGEDNAGNNNFFVYDQSIPALVSEFVSNLYWGREVIFDPNNTTPPYVGYFPMMAGWPWVTKFGTAGGSGITVQFNNSQDFGFNGLAVDPIHGAMYCTAQDFTSPDGSALVLQSIAKP